MRLLFFTLLIATISLPGLAQQYRFTSKKQYISIGGSVNANSFFGDIANSSSRFSTQISQTRPNFTAFIQKRATPRVTGRLSFSVGQLAGDDNLVSPGIDDNGRYQRGLHFRNNFFNISAVGIIDAVANKGAFFRRTSRFIPYGLVGIGVMRSNPEARVASDFAGRSSGSWVSLQDLETEGVSYSEYLFNIPLGVGIRKKINNNFDVALELVLHYTFTDYLDDISGNYADMSGWDPLRRAMASRSLEAVSARNGEVRTDVPRPTSVNGYTVGFGHGAPGDQRGNPENNDHFTSIGITVNYIFAGAIKSGKFR
jgi:hypothetical protein